MINVVDFAYQIVDMQRELEQLRSEVAELREYRRKFMEELDQSIAHSTHMIGGILELALVPGVMNAITEHNES